jgi:hypothetical protein
MGAAGELPGGTGPGVVHIPWYATLFRGDKFAVAVSEIAAVAIRYGALDYEVHRNRDDTYMFRQMATFPSKADFTRYWEGPEFIEFRARHSGWYQVPVLYVWHERLVRGETLVNGGQGTEAPAA